MSLPCPICSKQGVVAFDVAFANTKGWHKEYDDSKRMDFALCSECDLYWCVDMRDWDHDKFKQECYNETYVDFDGDINNPNGSRSLFHKQLLVGMFRNITERDGKILDYGCGKGFVVDYMRKYAGVNIDGYDPFSPNPNYHAIPRSGYKLITMFEVMEHVYNIIDVMTSLRGLLVDGGMIYATTDLTNTMHNVSENYYTCPRVGHVMLHSHQSLYTIAERTGFNVIHMPVASNGIQGHLFIKA